MNLDRICDFSRPALLWSGGRDSTLLLAFLRDLDIDFDIVQWGREHWTREQKRAVDHLIQVWDLKVMTFSPANVSFIGDGENISAVFEYAIGGETVPLLRDVIGGDRCIADLNGLRMDFTPIQWDCFIVGSKQSDTHYALRTLIPSEEWTVGNATFLAPLCNWDDEDVEAAIEAMEIPVPPIDANTGDLVNFCTNCLSKAEGDVWCPASEMEIPAQGGNLLMNLTNFRKRFEIQ